MPMAVGALRDASTGYLYGFIALILIALTGALIVSFLPKQKTVQ